MVKRFIVPLALTALLSVAAMWLPEAARPEQPQTAWTNQAAAQFWTPERMANAMPTTIPAPESTSSGPGPARHFAGIPTVGVLFSVDTALDAHYCSASVVHSPGHNLLLTAAHCDPGTNIVFVPQYTKGLARQPYGTWAVDQVFTDPRWTDYNTGSDYDFAFARVKPNEDGKKIEDITGANLLSRTPGWRNKVTVIGYPNEEYDPTGQPISCTTTTSQLSGLHQLQMDCGGYYTGTSGSPWLVDYNARTKTGQIIGLVGGLDGGGSDDSVSYSPFFDDAIFGLYRTATAT